MKQEREEKYSITGVIKLYEVVPLQAMDAYEYGGVEVQLNAFLYLAINTGVPAALTMGKSL
jgi:hypothetical protein